MKPRLTVSAATRARLQAAVEKKRLTIPEVARRASLNVRTVQRILDGETFDPRTADTIAEALGVEITGWDEDQVVQAVQDAMGKPVTAAEPDAQLRAHPRIEDRRCPVVGWKEAAVAVGVSRRTLLKLREQHGDMARRPWWRDQTSCREWFERMIGQEE